MSELVADCPRCGAKKITFNLNASAVLGTQNGWRRLYETFCVCRHCGHSTIFVVAAINVPKQDFIQQNGLANVAGVANDFVNILSYVSIKDSAPVTPPEHLPEPIQAAYNEGARCLSVECFNAAGTMFRLCVDLATRELPPKTDAEGLTNHIRRTLGLRLTWLFDHGLLPKELKGLSTCIKEDGNDGAHQGTLGKADADDLLDFSTRLLERLFTEPQRLRLAEERRAARRKP